MSKKIKYVTFGVQWLHNRINLNRLHTLSMRPRFHRLESVLDRRVEVKNPQCICIGHHVSIQPYVWLCAMINDLPNINVFDPSITIGDYSTIGRFCQITISNKLLIEDHVLITEDVLITDTIHGYADINTPIIKQPLVSRGPIIIGRGSWIGNGARIVGKVTIGKNSVVGSNAYVDKDVPDYCIVAGIPASIVKRFDLQKHKWISVDEPLLPLEAKHKNIFCR